MSFSRGFFFHFKYCFKGETNINLHLCSDFAPTLVDRINDILLDQACLPSFFFFQYNL